MKICNRCNTSKALTEFYKAARTKDGYQHTCKECCKPMHRKYNTENASLRKVKRDRYQSDNKARFDEWKKQQQCLICSEKETCCLDLHHVNPSEKERNVSDVLKFWSWERLMSEIEKCVVVCSNCHRKIHAGLITL